MRGIVSSLEQQIDWVQAEGVGPEGWFLFYFIFFVVNHVEIDLPLCYPLTLGAEIAQLVTGGLSASKHFWLKYQLCDE
jgi:hypothetical protein